MNFKHYVGIDISKNTLDVAVLIDCKAKALHTCVGNNLKGLKQLEVWLKKITGLDFSTTLFCMEHTGIYNYPVLNFLQKNKAIIWVERALQIKQSLGMQRGKNDKVDAQRIALYACKNVSDLLIWQPRTATMEELKVLNMAREQLINQLKRLNTMVNEYALFGEKSITKTLKKSVGSTIKSLEKDIAKIELKINMLIKEDAELNKKHQLITSITGIGKVTALNLIVHTNDFKLTENPRSLACHCGVAPFEKSSGLHKGKGKVSNLANKRLKTAFHMAALTAIKWDAEIKTYYDRKVGEGKNKMCVINAVRNKLVHRVCAVLKRGTPFQQNFSLN